MKFIISKHSVRNQTVPIPLLNKKNRDSAQKIKKEKEINMVAVPVLNYFNIHCLLTFKITFVFGIGAYMLIAST